jgi:hypothetical protein
MNRLSVLLSLSLSLSAWILLGFSGQIAQPQTKTGIEYPYATAEPQKTGWPLTPEEKAYVIDKSEHDRRPGRESNKHLPTMWPLVPAASKASNLAW